MSVDDHFTQQYNPEDNSEHDIIVFTTLGTKASICLQRAFAFFVVAHTLEKLHTPALKATVEIETSMEYSFFFFL
jgi:hypothetical protein